MTPVVPILNYVQLQQLRQALIVAEEGSFVGAGKRLNIHYSHVSRRVRDLETTVGFPIFERNGKGVTPTTAGSVILRGVRRVVDELESVLRMADPVTGGTHGTLSMGFYISMLQGELCEIVRDYACLHPEIELQFLEAPRAELAVAMNNRAIDLLISTSHAAVGASSMPLWRDRILVAVHADHAFAEKPFVEWSDLAAEMVVLRRHEPGSELHDLLRSHVGDAPDMRIVHHKVGRDSLLGLLDKNGGVALVYESDTGIGHPDIVYREIRNCGRVSRVGYLAQWRSDNANPALETFLNLLHGRYPSRKPLGSGK